MEPLAQRLERCIQAVSAHHNLPNHQVAKESIISISQTGGDCAVALDNVVCACFNGVRGHKLFCDQGKTTFTSVLTFMQPSAPGLIVCGTNDGCLCVFSSARRLIRQRACHESVINIQPVPVPGCRDPDIGVVFEESIAIYDRNDFAVLSRVAKRGTKLDPTWRISSRRWFLPDVSSKILKAGIFPSRPAFSADSGDLGWEVGSSVQETLPIIATVQEGQILFGLARAIVKSSAFAITGKVSSVVSWAMSWVSEDKSTTDGTVEQIEAPEAIVPTDILNDGRVVHCAAVHTEAGWLAIADDLGRVSVCSSESGALSFMLKGYRDSWIQWIDLFEGQENEMGTYTRAALVVTIPKRSMIEVWLVSCRKRLWCRDFLGTPIQLCGNTLLFLSEASDESSETKAPRVSINTLEIPLHVLEEESIKSIDEQERKLGNVGKFMPAWCGFSQISAPCVDGNTDPIRSAEDMQNG